MVRQLNGTINSDKYALLVVRPSARRPEAAGSVWRDEISVEGHRVKAVGHKIELRIGGKRAHKGNTYTKMVGGNINIVTRSSLDLAEVRTWAHIVRRKVKVDMPTL